jgi:NRPS condensation-like uncharacterized protein
MICSQNSSLSIQTTTIDGNQQIIEKENKNSKIEFVKLSNSMKSILPISYFEESLWIENQLLNSNEIDPYLMVYTWRIKGQLKIKLIEKSIQLLISKHDILRTTFDITSKGEPFQRVNLIANDFKIEQHQSKSKAKAIEWILNQQKQRFKLDQNFLLRAFLVGLSENEQIFSIVFHHIIFDAQSGQIFIKELNEIYSQLYNCKDENEMKLVTNRIEKQIEEACNSMKIMQYSEFSFYQRNILSVQYDKNIEYWKQKLFGITNIDLPFDFARSSNRNHSGESITFNMSNQIFSKLKQAKQNFKAEIFSILLSNLFLTMNKFFGNSNDVFIGTIVG